MIKSPVCLATAASLCCDRPSKATCNPFTSGRYVSARKPLCNVMDGDRVTSILFHGRARAITMMLLSPSSSGCGLHRSPFDGSTYRFRVDAPRVLSPCPLHHLAAPPLDSLPPPLQRLPDTLPIGHQHRFWRGGNKIINEKSRLVQVSP